MKTKMSTEREGMGSNVLDHVSQQQTTTYGNESRKAALNTRIAEADKLWKQWNPD